MDLRTNTDYFNVQNSLSVFCRWVWVCLLCCTGVIFNYNSG